PRRLSLRERGNFRGANPGSVLFTEAHMQQKKEGNFLFYIIIALMVFIFAISFVIEARAEEQHHHPPQDAELHDKFYSTWQRPDNPNISCCNKADCYPTTGKFENGTWYGKRREDGHWLPIPPEKIERKRDMPDTRVHMCAPPPGRPYYPAEHVFCFGFASGN
ncbi:MAG: hypothetical protein ABI612_22680, partial [Betaproteobacteria bacterium]